MFALKLHTPTTSLRSQEAPATWCALSLGMGLCQRQGSYLATSIKFAANPEVDT